MKIIVPQRIQAVAALVQWPDQFRVLHLVFRDQINGSLAAASRTFRDITASRCSRDESKI